MVLNLLFVAFDSVLSSIASSVKLLSSIFSSIRSKLLECSLPEKVYFVPHTEGSQLRNQLNRMEQEFGFECKVRYLEELGPTLASKLLKKEPNPLPCGRGNCLPCRSKPGVCQRQGCLYKLVCQLCIKEGREKSTVYIGESSRTPYDRGAEHLRLMERNDLESPAVEHTTEMHPCQETSFSLEVIRLPKTTLQRQVMEGHYISLNEKQNLINRSG